MMNRRHFLREGAAVVTGSLLVSRLPCFAAPSESSNIPLLERAKAALDQHERFVPHRDVVAIADFGKPSSAHRLVLVDLLSGRSTSMLVAHGKGSDPQHTGWLQKFSNEPGSEATSQGSYLTGEEYVGQHGRSRRLKGLDPQNDQAEARAIVVHAAWYVSPSIVAQHGKLGRSQGCFAVSESNLAPILKQLPPGRLLFAGKS